MTFWFFFVCVCFCKWKIIIGKKSSSFENTHTAWNKLSFWKLFIFIFISHPRTKWKIKFVQLILLIFIYLSVILLYIETILWLFLFFIVICTDTLTGKNFCSEIFISFAKSFSYLISVWMQLMIVGVLLFKTMTVVDAFNYESCLWFNYFFPSLQKCF